MATRLIAVILVILACIQVCRCDFPAENVTIEGYPRPKDFPDAPTVAYGKFPATRNDSGDYGTCDWYGWANLNSPAAVGAQCLPYVWQEYILNFLLLFPDYLPSAYYYYYCRPSNGSSEDPACYDNAAQDIICTVGCFDLSKSGLRLPPITKPGESTGTNVTSDGAAARFPQVPSLVLSMLAGAVFNVLARAR